MADKIKKFFERKKVDAKFKIAGPGRKLTDAQPNTSTSKGGAKKSSQPQKNVSQTAATIEAKRQAAQAALSRLEGQKKDSTFNSLSAIQAQVRRELEAERRQNSDKAGEPAAGSIETPQRNETAPLVEPPAELLAVKEVLYRCPIISDEILSKDKWKAKIRLFLFEQLEDERGLTACLMMHSCNYNRAKVKDCVDVLVRYIDNILGNPQEVKYHKIRCQNATFAQKVIPILGATEFLYAAGFRNEFLEHSGNTEEFYVFNETNIDGIDSLQFLRDSLLSEDRIEIELDRSLKVLSPSIASKRVELPIAFYRIKVDELKREQHNKETEIEKQMQLRTKAMREKDEQRELRKYNFALIRIRFPDGIYLQGTFAVYEKFGDVINFIKDNLVTDAFNFTLSTPDGHKMEEIDEEVTLIDLRLVPATILSFQWIDIDGIVPDTYLKSEILLLMESL